MRIVDEEASKIEDQFEAQLAELHELAELFKHPRVQRDIALTGIRMVRKLEREIQASLDWGILVK